MSETKKESLENNTELDYFDDDDLWEMQSEKPQKTNKTLESIESEELEAEENNESLTEELNILSLDDIDYPQEEESKSFVEESKIEKQEIEFKPEEIKQEINTNIEVENNEVKTEINTLENQTQELLKEQENIRKNISLLVQEGLKELEQKKQNLELEIQKLERRKEKIDREMKTTFSGVSQDLAIRVQGFKDYLVGSLQDLTSAVEQLELTNNNSPSWEETPTPTPINQNKNPNPSFVEKNFKEEIRQIRGLLDQYRTRPDYYGAPWQLRRTFEPIHAERVGEWFFTQGGRGSLRSMSSRLQNILIASAIMSILYQLYGDRTRTLILSDTPERLGEWRRGLQDCLGISRSDFGPNRGVVLFETPESLIQKGDRIIEEKDLPLVIMDQTDDKVSLSLLKFPLWLAFAPETTTQSSNYYY
ncbi:DUF3086 domain-containing protein [Geminocystis herdmanii]|uniref:DUF3086 domain-containing protein n=1 Tax=Geminocystis herdmanii TaxID=669359 RepID=UPI000349AB51|nr:DUF3086 domain-containing protein [Geminocystis herdmanii]